MPAKLTKSDDAWYDRQPGEDEILWVKRYNKPELFTDDFKLKEVSKGDKPKPQRWAQPVTSRFESGPPSESKFARRFRIKHTSVLRGYLKNRKRVWHEFGKPPEYAQK
jgi:hypothetical protein